MDSNVIEFQHLIEKSSCEEIRYVPSVENLNLCGIDSDCIFFVNIILNQDA